MKVYIVSGLGAGFKVLEKLKFPEDIEPVFLDWLLPEPEESFPHYVQKMADRIEDSEDFYLLGYSFGGIVVQEIHKLKPAKKVIILGSIRSDKEKSILIKLGEWSKLPKYIPLKYYDETSSALYAYVARFFDLKHPKVQQYFQVRDPYYLKWSIDKISEWKFDALPNVIQILGDKDAIFPIKNSKPDFVIKNGTHLFPATKPREVSEILSKVLSSK
ncbi:alpha/beta hydrolase [Bergeyella porcorum]|uniref:alpha/beta hydrolase n=1 Tax=Bergeyella porcorum TaxID=1735111 RepID=UPI0035E9829E